MTIMPTLPPRGGTSAGTGSLGDQNSAFRDADFMKILLSEITQQDPFKPQETSKIIEGMQKVQELANTRYEKFRADQRWAQDLVGASVTVQQVQSDPDMLAKLRERGVDPDVGYQSVSATVERFRIVDETVWIHAGGKDYPIDNVRQINPPTPSGEQLGVVAAGMLNTIVQYRSADGTTVSEGRVNAIGFGANGGIELTIGEERIPVGRVQRIRL